MEEAWAVKPDDSTIVEHYRYLEQYFIDVTGVDAYHWPPSICQRFCHEAARIRNEFLNDIDDHPYLRGTLDEETGEITITGLKCYYITTFYPYANGRYYDSEIFGYNSGGRFVEMDIKDLVIPDTIDGHPVTKIADYAFALFYPEADNPGKAHFSSVVIGDNVREIGDDAFSAQHVTIKFGKGVETIGNYAFSNAWGGEIRITDWGDSLKTIGSKAFIDSHISAMPPFPDTLETIGECAFSCLTLPETIILPPSVQFIDYGALGAGGVNRFVMLHRNTPIEFGEYSVFPYFGDNNKHIYCYAGFTAEAELKRNRYSYDLIDGDGLLWDGEAVERNELNITEGMTEAELRSHLSIDGTSSEIQIDGLQDGKVVNGTTVTLFHTAAQAPGKVYTVEAVPRLAGDADGDGGLSLLDVARLVRYIAGGWDVTVDVSNSDVNADGLVNLKDAALLRRFLVGWDVVLR